MMGLIMSSPIDNKTIKHLAELARLELSAKEEERLVNDLQNIIEYFEELTALDTTGVAPMAGGMDTKNVFRGDTDRENTDRGAGSDAFPESENGYNKIPGVF